MGIRFVKSQLADYIEAAVSRTHFDDMLSELEILHELVRFHPGLRKETAGLSGALRLRCLMNRISEMKDERDGLTP